MKTIVKKLNLKHILSFIPLTLLLGAIQNNAHAQFYNPDMRQFRTLDQKMPPIIKERHYLWEEYFSVNSGKKYKGEEYDYLIKIDTNNNTIDPTNNHIRKAFVLVIPVEYVTFAPDEYIEEIHKNIIYGYFVLSTTTDCKKRTIRYHTAYFYDSNTLVDEPPLAYAVQNTPMHSAKNKNEKQLIDAICP